CSRRSPCGCPTSIRDADGMSDTGAWRRDEAAATPAGDARVHDESRSKGERQMSKSIISKRDFLKKAGLTTAGAAAATTLAAPHVRAQSPITWRLQTY